MRPHNRGLEFDQLTKAYGSFTAVDGLSLVVHPGQIFCFLGPNGAGKSTTIHTLVGLKHPTAGDVRIDGVSIRSPEIHAVRRGLGYLADQPVMYDYLTGREFVQFVARFYGASEAQVSTIDRRFEEFNLESHADSLTKTYSLGMRKKLAVIAATIYEPHVLVFDEPTGALDTSSARVVKDLMVEARSAGKTVFFSTHTMDLAEKLADRIGIIARGQLIGVGSLPELREQFGTIRGESLEDLFLRVTSSAEVGNTQRTP